MTVFLDGSEVFRVDVLIRIFQQGALQHTLRVPRLRPGLQVLLYRLGDSFVVRRHNLGSVVPVHLREAVGKYFSVHSPSLKHSNIMDCIDILFKVLKAKKVRKKVSPCSRCPVWGCGRQ